jgi:trans-AT polyketide synthase/acyltransferase/oxidoreductase domain-containing protein
MKPDRGSFHAVLGPPSVLLFPGQGAQYYRMGEALFQEDEAFTKILVDLDAGLTDLGHPSIIDRLFAPSVTKTTPCDDVRFTHPALMMIEIAVAQRLMKGGIVPEVAFAVSLGEYAAAAVAGVLPAVEFLDCIARSAQVIEAKCPVGGMLTVMSGAAELGDLRGITRVGTQGKKTVVLAGAVDAIAKAKRDLEARGILCVAPPVTRAFHSADLDLAAPEIRRIFQGRAYQTPAFPIISARLGARLTRPDAEHYARIGRDAILFDDAVATLETRFAPMRLIDVGPSGGLATSVAQALGADKRWQARAILSPFSDHASQVQRLRTILEAEMKDIARPENIAHPQTRISQVAG